MSSTRSANVYHRILRRHAAQQPSKVFLQDGVRSLTYRETDQATNHLALQLADLGVERGATVLVMKPSGLDYVLLWFAIMKLGAIFVPMNDSYRGNILVHQANDSGARLMVVHGNLVDRLDAVAERLHHLEHLLLVAATEDQAVNAQRHWKTSDFATLQGFSDTAVDAGAEPYDPMAIFYTSGTTGPSKGVLYSHGQAYATARPFADELAPSDIFYMTNPMFHVALPHLVGAVLIPGAGIVVRERFSIEAFWPDIRKYGATVTLLLGTIPSYISGRPSQPDDQDHALRKVLMVPVLPDVDSFRARFGVEVMTWFNMTEVSTPLHSDGYKLANPQSCGRPREGVEARIVDEHDMPVSPGSVGELVIRTTRPWELNLGYWKNPEATAAAWRNLWLHTGDLFRQDEEGNFYFIDRLKDAIRRRGENVSSYEVEAEVLAHPAVHECAAVAAPSEHGEDEIRIVVSLKPGSSLAPDELLDFLQPRMPYFMVPRFVQIQQDELAKTPTGKIQKVMLREAGIAQSWDREAAGYVVRR